MSDEALPLPAESRGSPGASLASLPANWVRAARLAWVLLVVVALGVILAALPPYAAKFNGQLGHVGAGQEPPGAHFFAAASAVASLASVFLSLTLSALLFRRRFHEPVAMLLTFFLLFYAVVMAGPLELAAAHWGGERALIEAAQSLFMFSPMVALLLLFPNGRFVPRWTRWVLLISLPWNLLTLLVLPYSAGGVARNPPLFALIATGLVGFYAAGIYAQIYRYRRISTAAEREQTRWAVFGFAIWIAYMLVSSVPYFYLTTLPPGAAVPWWAPASELGWWLSISILPVCLTIAITRYQLWNIDLIINRTLVYGSLTVIIVGLYALLVGGMGALFQTQGSWPVTLVITGLVAVLFQPLRDRLQRGVNRMLYGERDDPLAVLSHLGEQLEGTLSPDMVYPTIVETVSRALKLPYAAVAVGPDGRLEIVESYGRAAGEPVAYPLIYQGEQVGQLLVARRAPDEAFSPADERILRNIARQAGAAVHAAQLMADLQQSRRRLVTAREEERRRLRRDLHDGLGPQLASQILTINAIDKLLARDPEQARALLDDLKAQSRFAVQDIRRLVYDLRPPALDELGLVGALREAATRHSRDGLRVRLQAPERLPALPAAVEVAAFRVVQEALTNVARHAGADNCTVHLEPLSLAGREAFRVTVRDDGRGLPPDGRAGVGLQSMRERAAELGGSCKIVSEPGQGVRVTAVFPLPEAPPEEKEGG